MLSLLLPEELDKFRDFVASPFFNGEKKLSRVLEQLIKETSVSKGVEDKMGKSISQKGRLGSKKIYSQLVILHQRFVGYLSFEANRIPGAMALREYIRMGYLESFPEMVHELRNKVKAKALHVNGLDSLYDRFQLDWLDALLQAQSSVRKANPSLQNAYQSWKLLAITGWLKLLYAVENERVFVSETALTANTDAVMTFLESQAEDLDDPYLTMHLLALKTLGESGATAFHQLKQHLEINMETYSHEALQDLHSAALNFAIRRYNQEELEYGEEVEALLRMGLTHGILLNHRGMLSGFQLRNHTITMLRMGCFEQVVWLLNTYASRLEHDHKGFTVHLCWSMYHVFRREYEVASKHLARLERKRGVDHLLILDRNAYCLIVAYAQADWEHLDDIIGAAKVYLSQNKTLIGKTHYRSYNNMILFMDHLRKLKTEVNAPVRIKKAQMNLERMGRTKPVACRWWLEEAFGELCVGL